MKTSRIREFKNFCLAAAILVAGASLASCSSSDDIAENNQQPVENPTAPKIYTMTIQASKGDGATTRALTLSGSTLNATWATTENVYVKKGGTWATSSLKPQEDGTTTTLKGSLSGITIVDNDNLTLQFPKGGDITYAGQVGTIANIQENFDWATASVEVETVSGTGNITPKAATTTFTNQQAIIKFTLLNKANDAAISPSALTVSDGTSTVELTQIPAATYTTNGNGVLYVAFPAAGSAKTVTLTATVGRDKYTYEKSGVTFTNGKYYEITVKMTKSYDNTVKINEYAGSEPIAVPAGKHWLITGTGSETSNRITIAEGAAVTLSNVNINGVGTVTSGDYAGITCVGNATIILADGTTNIVKGFDYNYPGIFVPEGSTLTIDGTGSLNASSNTEDVFGVGSPGIGSGYKEGTCGTCGNIIIQGSVNVTASGGANAAGIGSGNEGTCGTITIKGGTITAMGGANAAGIGSGGGNCGTITITGGTITATGGSWAAGIGSGNNGSCGTITIASTVSSVTATKGGGADNSIGAGAGGSCGTVTIENGANVTQY